MNKHEVKKLFWKIVNYVHDCSDTTIENKEGVVTERGMSLSGDYSIMFGLDDGILRLYNSQNEIIAEYTEDSEALVILKDLFEDMEE